MCQPAAWFWQKLKSSQSVVNLDYNFAINPSRGHPNESCVSMAWWQCPQGSIPDLVRSSTIKSGAAPDSTILSRVCEVQTASVRAPAARPAINPDGASSTTRPAASRACSAACHRFVLPLLYHAGRTVLWVYSDTLGAGEVWVRLGLAALDVVGSHIARGGLQHACA